MHDNTVAKKGVRKAFAEPELWLHYDKKDPRHAMKYRGRDDPTWFEQMEGHVRKTYPEFIEGFAFDEDFLLFMSERALHRQANPLNLPMTPEQRARMISGRTQLHSEPVDRSIGFGDTTPLTSHPDYHQAKFGNAASSVPPPPPQPKSSGIGKGRGKGKKR